MPRGRRRSSAASSSHRSAVTSVTCAFRWTPPRSTPSSRNRVEIDAQGQVELEARVGIVYRVPEQLAQLADAIADGLRVDVELRGDRRGMTLAGQPGGKRPQQTFALPGREAVQR